MAKKALPTLIFATQQLLGEFGPWPEAQQHQPVNTGHLMAQETPEPCPTPAGQETKRATMSHGQCLLLPASPDAKDFCRKT